MWATRDGKDPRTWVLALACGRAAADMEIMAAILSGCTGCACVSACDAGHRRVLGWLIFFQTAVRGDVTWINGV